jgi:hypothetical protein
VVNSLAVLFGTPVFNRLSWLSFDRLRLKLVEIYQTKEDNTAIALADVFAPDGSQAYRTESGTKSRGIEMVNSLAVLFGTPVFNRLSWLSFDRLRLKLVETCHRFMASFHKL